jgi:hypothetical protein
MPRGRVSIPRRCTLAGEEKRLGGGQALVNSLQPYAGYTEAVDWTSLPGGELIREGLEDAAAGRRTIGALLVAIGAPRLRRAGVDVPEIGVADPEHRLYEVLAEDDSDAAHSRYNALIRQLVSFERALECAA